MGAHSNPVRREDAKRNPFLEDVFVDDGKNLPGVARIHQLAATRIHEAAELLQQSAPDPCGGLGRIFLLSSSEAGSGMSHLLGRLRLQLEGRITSLLLPFDRSRPATWPVALASVLRQLCAVGQAETPRRSVMDDAGGFFLGRLILEAVENGNLVPRDCPVEIDSVRDLGLRLSRERNPKILLWLDKHASNLARAASPGLSRRLSLSPAEVGFWTRVCVDLLRREEGALEKLRGLSQGEARERILQLLRLVSDHRPVMLVADGLDGFFHSDTAGMEVAEILNGIRERVPRSMILLCANDDLWNATFAPKLPGAWIDRLNGENIHLPSIPAEAARELVRFRMRGVPLAEKAATRFIDELSQRGSWTAADTPLTPRKVLRQASKLWLQDADQYLSVPTEEETFDAIAEDPLSSLTDKADFFRKLNEETEDQPSENPPPLPSIPKPAPAPPAAAPEVRKAPAPEEVPARAGSVDLSGIDSIINDIRGTGKTVVSETSASRFENENPFKPDRPPVPPVNQPAPTPPTPAPAAPREPLASPMPAPEPKQAPVQIATEPGLTPETIPSMERISAPSSFFKGLSFPTKSEGASRKPKESAPLTRASIEQRLAQREQELLAGAALALDLERLARFIRFVGSKHPALGQQEERYPSSRTVALRWNARGYSALCGFESPKNVYFWNNLLQQSLASNRSEKIAAFSHPSEKFDPALFASFGFSPPVIRGRIDVIEMCDRELAMIYAADRVLQDHINTPDEERAVQLITMHLDPLWRRIIQPL